MAEKDELIFEISELLTRLIEEGHIEIASPRAVLSLAGKLLRVLKKQRAADVGEWLLEQPDVSEVYLDSEELRPMFSGVLARMAHDDPPPKHNQDLAKAILAAPEDMQARLVYADWLQENDDPRGELIAIQAQREKGENREGMARLARAEAGLLGRYRRHFFGDLPRDERCSVTLRFGFFDRATVRDATVVDELISLESSRFLQALAVHSPMDSVIEGVLKARALPAALTDLELGNPVSYGQSTLHLDLAHATRGLSLLHSLALVAGSLTGAALALPSLRALALHLEQLPSSAKAAAVVVALFDAPPARLSSLRLNVKMPFKNYVERLCRSRLLAQLRKLDFSGTAFDANDLQLLLAHASALAHLECLDLRGTRIPATANAAARGLCANVLLGPVESKTENGTQEADERDEEYDDDEEEEDEDEDLNAEADQDGYDEPAYDEDDRTVDDGTESDEEKEKDEDDEGEGEGDAEGDAEEEPSVDLPEDLLQ